MRLVLEMNNIQTHILDTFPTRETILFGMGFSEIPIVNGFPHLLYITIYNSLWFGDIHNRYMPNYKQYFFMTTIFYQQHNEFLHSPDEDLYSYDRYFRCAMMEYGKLSRYMSHCHSRGLDLDFFCGDYYVLIERFPGKPCDEEYDTPDFDSIFIPFNKRKIRSMRRTRMSIMHYKTKIRELTEQLQQSLLYLNNNNHRLWCITNDRPPVLLSLTCESSNCESSTCESSTSNSDLLQEHIHKLEDDMESIKTKLDQYKLIQSIRSELKINLENLQKYKLIDDLHMRSVEFCRPDLVYSGNYGFLRNSYTDIQICSPHFQTRNNDTYTINQCPRQALLAPDTVTQDYQAKPVRLGLQNIMSTLPDELVRIIYSFIGKDTLDNVRKKCIMDRYFPDGREDVSKLLKQWRNNELLLFSKQVFLMYELNFERGRTKRITIRKTSNKTELIENLLRCQHRFTFYEFMRDVFIISRILNDRRRRQISPSTKKCKS